MVKITVEGKEVPRIVTYPEAPQPPELIEQCNGQRVTVETCRALEFSTVEPGGDGEAAELVGWLWEHAGETANVSGRWTGWQVAAWIATNDVAVVARLASPIEFKTRDGGRRILHSRSVEACLRWEIATRHCSCGADRGDLCLCLDEAFGKLNVALRDGALIELSQQSLGPVNREKARGMLFASRAVQMKFPARKQRGRPAGNGIDDSVALAEMARLLKSGEANTPTGAARLAAELAAGSTHGTSTVDRLRNKWKDVEK